MFLKEGRVIVANTVIDGEFPVDFPGILQEEAELTTESVLQELGAVAHHAMHASI